MLSTRIITSTTRSLLSKSSVRVAPTITSRYSSTLDSQTIQKINQKEQQLTGQSQPVPGGPTARAQQHANETINSQTLHDITEGEKLVTGGERMKGGPTAATQSTLSQAINSGEIHPRGGGQGANQGLGGGAGGAQGGLGSNQGLGRNQGQGGNQGLGGNNQTQGGGLGGLNQGQSRDGFEHLSGNQGQSQQGLNAGQRGLGGNQTSLGGGQGGLGGNQGGLGGNQGGLGGGNQGGLGGNQSHLATNQPPQMPRNSGTGNLGQPVNNNFNNLSNNNQQRTGGGGAGVGGGVGGGLGGQRSTPNNPQPLPGDPVLDQTTIGAIHNAEQRLTGNMNGGVGPATQAAQAHAGETINSRTLHDITEGEKAVTGSDSAIRGGPTSTAQSILGKSRLERGQQ